MASILSVKGLHAGYGKADVLDGLDLELPQGAVVTVIGPTGAGQSTARNALMGVLASRGQVVFAGHDLGERTVGEGVMSGRGLVAETQVTFGGEPAAVMAASDDRTRLTVTVPGSAAVGPVDVSATNDNGTADLPGGYVYFDPARDGLSVAGIAPASGPVEGGNVAFIAGSGFGAEAVVEVAGRAIDCERLDENVLQCTMPPGDLGPVDVSVQSGGDRVDLPGAYTYYESVEVLAVRPEEGAIAGNTFVAITGRGFVDGMSVDFGGIPLVDVRVVDDGRLEARTPPNTAGSRT